MPSDVKFDCLPFVYELVPLNPKELDLERLKVVLTRTLLDVERDRALGPIEKRPNRVDLPADEAIVESQHRDLKVEVCDILHQYV